MGLASFVFTLWGHKTKETYPTRPGSPTPCKQGLSEITSTTLVIIICYPRERGILNNVDLSFELRDKIHEDCNVQTCGILQR